MRNAFIIAPLTQEVWNQYRGLHVVRSLPVPPRPDVGTFVLWDGRLVAGVSLYPSGPFVMAEYLVTNPSEPTRRRHGAVLRAAAHSAIYAAQTGKSLFWVLRTGHVGLARSLLRVGAVPITGQPWTMPPTVRSP